MPAPRQPSRHPFLRGIALVGMGRWGCSLHAALTNIGFTPLETVAGRSALHGATLDAGLIWLCVPDAAIARVADEIVEKRGSLRNQMMVHSSGVYSGNLLSAARRAGAKVGSIHPLMTFPTRRPVPLADVPFAMEGNPVLVGRIERLILRLKGKPFRIPSSGKPLYHAAAVMASPLLVSLAAAVQETAMLAGLNASQADALIEPMMTATLCNFFRRGADNSFSGPFARGDAATVSLHLEALKGHPSLQQLYRALAEHALRVLPVQQERALRHALVHPVQPILGKGTVRRTRYKT